MKARGRAQQSQAVLKAAPCPSLCSAALIPAVFTAVTEEQDPCSEKLERDPGHPKVLTLSHGGSHMCANLQIPRADNHQLEEQARTCASSPPTLWPGLIQQQQETCPMAPHPWPGPQVPSTHQPSLTAGHPAPTRHSGHQAQGSQHTERSQGLHVKAAFSPRRASLLHIDLLQGHGDEPERARAQGGKEGKQKEGQGEREAHENGDQEI